jgi:hypothetical protein
MQQSCFHSIFLLHFLHVSLRKTTEPVTPKLYRQICYNPWKFLLGAPTALLQRSSPTVVETE